jgi:hypothetical protein
MSTVGQWQSFTRRCPTFSRHSKHIGFPTRFFMFYVTVFAYLLCPDSLSRTKSILFGVLCILSRILRKLCWTRHIIVLSRCLGCQASAGVKAVPYDRLGPYVGKLRLSLCSSPSSGTGSSAWLFAGLGSRFGILLLHVLKLF